MPRKNTNITNTVSSEEVLLLTGGIAVEAIKEGNGLIKVRVLMSGGMKRKNFVFVRKDGRLKRLL